MKQAMRTHLGEALGTDFFSVRERFTDEQWTRFITVRNLGPPGRRRLGAERRQAVDRPAQDHQGVRLPGTEAAASRVRRPQAAARCEPVRPAHGLAGAAGLGRPRPAGRKGIFALYTPQLRRISVMRKDYRRSSQDDAQGQPRGTAALHQAGDVMPVDVVGIDLGQRLGDAELGEPCHAPVVHEQFFVSGGLAAGDG